MSNQVTLDDLASQMKSLSELVDKASNPKYRDALNNGRAHVGDQSFAYWSHERNPGRFQEVIHNDPETFKRKALPKGYQGAHNEDAKFETFSSFLKSGLLEDGHKTEEFRTRQKAIFKGINGMSIQSGSDGGYLLAPEWAEGILARTYGNTIHQLCDNYTVGTNGMKFRRDAETSRKKGKRHGGLQSFWIAEGQLAIPSSPKLKLVDLYCKKLVVVVYLTDELIKDSSGAAESWINRIVGGEFEFMIGDAIFNGLGVNMPIGIHKAPNRVVVSKNGASAGTITEDIVDRMWARRAVSGGGQYKWFHNQDCCPQLDGLAQDVGTGGVALYRPNGSIAGTPYQTLKGAPRIETEFNESVGTEGDLTLADLSKYVTISTGGITQESSIHVEFLSGQTALKFTMRIDGQPWEDSPIEPYKGTNLQSATIVCENR